MREKSVVIERSYNAPFQEVWQALTDRNQMKEWYFDLEEFKAEPGFEFQFPGGTETRKYLHFCKVIEVIVGKKLSYTWRYDGIEGNSLVSFELFSEDDGSAGTLSKTRLVLTHSGLDSFPPDHVDINVDGFAQGWTHIIGTSLKDYVEKIVA